MKDLAKMFDSLYDVVVFGMVALGVSAVWLLMMFLAALSLGAK